MKRLLLYGLAFCISLWSSGCAPLRTERDRPSYTVSVVLKALNSNYWLDMRSGMEQAAKTWGIDLVLLYPSSELENEEQQDLIADALESETDLLLFAPCDSYNTQWVVERAQEKEIPVLTVDTRALDSDLPYIGSDNTEIGTLVGAYFSGCLQEGAAVVVMAGSDSQASHKDRIDSLRSHMNPSISIIEIFHTDMTQIDSYNSMKTMEGRSFDGVFCANAAIGLGASTGLAEMGRAVPVIMVGTPMEAYQMLKDGTVSAVLSQDGYEIGYQAITAAVETLESGELPSDILFPSELMTTAGQEAAQEVPQKSAQESAQKTAQTAAQKSVQTTAQAAARIAVQTTAQKGE